MQIQTLVGTVMERVWPEGLMALRISTPFWPHGAVRLNMTVPK